MWSRNPPSFCGIAWTLLAAACGNAAPELAGPTDLSPDAGATGGATQEPVVEAKCESKNPVPNEGRLLTRLQYRSTVADLFDGLQVNTGAFPPENEVLRFRTNASDHRATSLLVEAHMLAAEEVSAAIAAELPRRLPCEADARETCGLEYIRELAPRVFRRPLQTAEAATFEMLFREQLPLLGLARSTALVVEALLQSPQFLYRLDFEGAALDDASGFELTGYETASRLSYFLWNSMPDAQLFDASAMGELSTRAQVEAQARRMVDDPRARKTIDDFHEQWLGLARLSSVARRAPGLAERELGESFRTSLALYLDHTFWQEGASFDALMRSETVFVNPALATLLGVQAPAADGFVPTRLTDGARSGLLTQPGLLSLLAHSDQSSPIVRGVFVREEILCQPPPPPPPSIDQTVPDPDPNATTRERFRVHTVDPACASCHSLIDPIGLGFENYDHLGRYRKEENGLPVDASGSVVAVREASIEGPFTGAVQLATRLAKSEQARTCLATQWYRYASGRVEEPVDRCSIAQALEMFEGGDMKELLIGIAASDAFRFRAEAEPSAEEASQ